MEDKVLTLTTEQLDDILKQWKRKGAERALGFVFAGSFPLVILDGVFTPEISPLDLLTACAIYYCAVALLAVLTL